jgi:hypothetical protein
VPARFWKGFFGEGVLVMGFEMGIFGGGFLGGWVSGAWMIAGLGRAMVATICDQSDSTILLDFSVAFE